VARTESIIKFLEPVVGRLAGIDGIAAVVLGGSHARGTADRNSDIDLGLYYDPERPFAIDDLDAAAREIDDRHASRLVTDFGEWGPGVNGGGWLLVRGRHVDFLYRDLVAVRRAIDECRAGQPKTLYQLGHPLGFHNQIYAGEVNCCEPLHDPRAVLKGLKTLVARYPPMLRRSLVTKHLFDAAFELDIAMKPAWRGDVMYASGCMFRAAGFMTLVLYALNRGYFINEKGALAESRKFAIRPRGFHATVARILAHPGEGPAELTRSVARLRAVVEQIRKLPAVRAAADSR
jgi:nucleotidyltransferase-like protein